MVPLGQCAFWVYCPPTYLHIVHRLLHMGWKAGTSYCRARHLTHLLLSTEPPVATHGSLTRLSASKYYMDLGPRANSLVRESVAAAIAMPHLNLAHELMPQAISQHTTRAASHMSHDSHVWLSGMNSSFHL